MLDAFLCTGNIVGVTIYGERYGETIFPVVTNFNISVLEVPKLQKTIPNYNTCHTLPKRSVGIS
jgi:hypothetical protein